MRGDRWPCGSSALSRRTSIGNDKVAAVCMVDAWGTHAYMRERRVSATIPARIVPSLCLRSAAGHNVAFMLFCSEVGHEQDVDSNPFTDTHPRMCYVQSSTDVLEFLKIHGISVGGTTKITGLIVLQIFTHLHMTFFVVQSTDRSHSTRSSSLRTLRPPLLRIPLCASSSTTA